jgi:hypothetical protein
LKIKNRVTYYWDPDSQYFLDLLGDFSLPLLCIIE